MSRAILSRCAECGAPIQQSATGRPRRYCGATCRKAAHRARGTAWVWMEENDPQAANVPSMKEMWAAEHAGAVPSPDYSTVEDVTMTILAAVAVCAELRRHSVAAEPVLAVRCEVVASALDAALAAEFRDVLKV